MTKNDPRGAVVTGVDGCPGGWIAVTMALADGRLDAALGACWSNLDLARARFVAVDMPIGLTAEGPRTCDLAARYLLPKGRKSSVFPPPRRYMLHCRTWEAAHREGLEREGSGLNKQTWNILPKIRELDHALRPADQDRIREAHPELVFHHLNDWAPLPGKRKPDGREARLRLLAGAGLQGVAQLLDRYPRSEAQPDDVIDAAACALAAWRMARGTAIRLPATPRRDERGLAMEIWY